MAIQTLVVYRVYLYSVLYSVVWKFIYVCRRAALGLQAEASALWFRFRSTYNCLQLLKFQGTDKPSQCIPNSVKLLLTFYF
jgi:hypothetical protein